MDANGDYVVGPGAFWIDRPEGVAQAVKTRLAFWQGQDVQFPDDGTPWLQKIVGVRTAQTRDEAIKAIILATPGVNAILAYAGTLNSPVRTYTVVAKIDTDYGVANLIAETAVLSGAT